MREGVDREGGHLYPVFPYDHFNLVADADLHALYAFLMTREPVTAEPPANDVTFPLGFRPLLAEWKLLYLRPREFHPEPAQSAEWNRGAYLAEGLGHCGACHTPRNALGAVRRDRHFAGGEAEGWIAPALDASSPAPVPWTRERLIAYLRNTVYPEQGIPAGPMLPVAHNLAIVPEQDVNAIATYVASVVGAPGPERMQSANAVLERVRRDEESAARTLPTTGASTQNAAENAGGDIYQAACATCHGAGRGIGSAHAMHLALSTSIALPSPINLLHIIEEGVRPRPGERGRWMPSFRGTFTDSQLASLASHVRTGFGPGEPWRDVEQDVRKLRSGEGAQ
jgi:mono/diheme cytochrome c family protein